MAPIIPASDSPLSVQVFIRAPSTTGFNARQPIA
jgi:hypothetical protein